MKKMKVMTIVGTRPEIIRLSRVISKLDECTDHILVHTGQNYDYELNEIFFSDLKLRAPNFVLKVAGKSSSQTIGNVIIEVDKLLEKVKPEAILILGDTNSCLSALPAKRRKIPIFHMEAGNRCFDQRVPEEINRRIVDHTADINLTYSSIAREYLLNEGISSDMVIKTGSPLNEVFKHYREVINKSKILIKLNLTENQFFLVSAHREEHVDNEKNLKKLFNILNSLSEEYKIPVIVSTHPRTKARIDDAKVTFNKGVRLLKPLGFNDYNKLQISSRAVLSDSGSISEESSILNFPALNIRENHERPESFEEASVMMVGLEKERILQSLSILELQPRGDHRLLREVSDYSATNVSEKVVRIIQSYTDYVNRVVWKKS